MTLHDVTSVPRVLILFA